MIVDRGEVPAQLIQLRVTHQECSRLHQVGGPKNGIYTVLIQQEFLRHRVRLGIGHQILAELAVHVVGPVPTSGEVKADGNAVDQFVLVAGVDQDAHRGRQVINAMKVALGEGAEGPQTGEHLFQRLGQVILVFVRLLALRVVKPRTVEPGQIFVVGAGSVAPMDARAERFVQRCDRRDDPFWRLCVLDVIAQFLERIHLCIEARLEIFISQHGLDAGIEIIGLHELVVEVERYRKPVGHGPRWKAQCSQHGHISRLNAERLPVIEADLTEGLDLGDREVALRRLGLGGPRRLVVSINFCGRGGADCVSGLGHFVPDVAADERRDGGIVNGVSNEGVGHTILNGAQVDMRQRGLGHGGNDAGHAGKIVGQSLVDYHIAGMGPVVRVQVPQPAVPFRLVQREKVDLAVDVLLKHEVDTRFSQQRQVVLDILKIEVGNIQGQVVLKQRHAGGEQSVYTRHKAEGMTDLPNLEREDPHAAIRGNEILVIAEPTSHYLIPFQTHDIQEGLMERMRVGVYEVDTRLVGVHADQDELDYRAIA